MGPPPGGRGLCRPAVTACWCALVGAAMAALLSACERGEARQPVSPAGGLVAAPLAERAPAPAGAPLFEPLGAGRTGIGFTAAWPYHLPDYQPQLDSEKAGGGVAIGDYTGDGLPDLFLTRPFGGPRMYRNLGGFRFADATDEAGLAAPFAWDTGATFADVNNDGLLDLYVCSFLQPNRLYINRGDGTFVERAAEYGLDYNGASIMAAFADYTGDGRLDLYLVTNRAMPTDRDGRSGPEPRIVRDGDDSYSIHPDQWEVYGLRAWFENGHKRHTLIRAGQRDRLFRNDGPAAAPRFTDVTEAAGISGYDRGLAATWWDYDADGRPDLYVSNDFFGQDRLYRNNGDGTFSDVIGGFTGRTPWFSMGADIADVNNSGRMDLMASDMAETTHYGAHVTRAFLEDSAWFLTVPEPRMVMRNTLYLNAGVERFIDIAPMLGVDRSDWTWAILFGDLNNNGWADLFITNGMTRDFSHSDLRDVPMPDLPEKPARNLALRNTGELDFEDVGAAWGLDHLGISFGAAIGDLDGSGNLDIVVNNFDEPVSVYRNTEGEARRVKVRLKGRVSNSHGIGATVRIHTAAGRQMRYLTLARGFMSSSEPVAHFGLGDVSVIDRLTVEWPSGHVQQFTDLPADHLYTVVEPSTPR